MLVFFFLQFWSIPLSQNNGLQPIVKFAALVSKQVNLILSKDPNKQLNISVGFMSSGCL